MKHLLPLGLLAGLALSVPCPAADPAPALLTAHGTVEKVEKDTLTVKPRGADGKFGKGIVLRLTGTSKLTTLVPQTRDGKQIMAQKDADAKDLKADQPIAVIYTGGDNPILLSAVVTAAGTGPVLPEPTGNFSVGRITYYLLDSSRDDERGTQKDHKREFMVQVWYPAQSGSKGKPAAWLLPEWVRLGNNYSDLLAKSRDPLARKDVDTFLASIVVHAHEDVPVASSPKPFPVILLAPGSISFPSKYTSLAEDLASHGFVVVGDVPVGNGIKVPFPAGNVTSGYQGEMFALWTGDLIYELDQLKAWNETKGHLFFGRLDLEHVGAFGHSAGGLIVSRIPHMDKRVKAIARLDPGYVRPEDGEAIPVLILKSDNSDSPNSREKAKTETEYAQKAKPGIQMKLFGAEHASFTDLAVIRAFDRPGDGKALNDTTRAVLRAFFGQYLLGTPSELLVKRSTEYPRLEIEKNPEY